MWEKFQTLKKSKENVLFFSDPNNISKSPKNVTRGKLFFVAFLDKWGQKMQFFWGGWDFRPITTICLMPGKLREKFGLDPYNMPGENECTSIVGFFWRPGKVCDKFGLDAYSIPGENKRTSIVRITRWWRRTQK
jgi:hypothetical protein